jgi:hypothetical protein
MLQSLRHLLKAAASNNDDSEALNLAIQVVGAQGGRQDGRHYCQRGAGRG